jgi:hypothetical protein
VGAHQWLGIVKSAGPLCALGKQVSWHPQNGRLPLNGRVGFPLFHGVVVSTGPLWREASWRKQNSQAWSLGFTCMCGSELLALSSKLRVPVGQQAGRLNRLVPTVQ